MWLNQKAREKQGKQEMGTRGNLLEPSRPSNCTNVECLDQCEILLRECLNYPESIHVQCLQRQTRRQGTQPFDTTLSRPCLKVFVQLAIQEPRTCAARKVRSFLLGMDSGETYAARSVQPLYAVGK